MIHMAYILFGLLLVMFIFYGINIVSDIRKNEQVFKFRKQILDLSDEWTRRQMKQRFIGEEEMFYHYYKLPPYKEMVKSKKPIKFQTYFNEKEIRELLNC